MLSLKFNVSKSHCMIIGKMYKTKISPMLMGNQLVEWCDCIKYLGVYLVSSSDIKFDINPEIPFIGFRVPVSCSQRFRDAQTHSQTDTPKYRMPPAVFNGSVGTKIFESLASLV